MGILTAARRSDGKRRSNAGRGAIPGEVLGGGIGPVDVAFGAVIGGPRQVGEEGVGLVGPEPSYPRAPQTSQVAPEANFLELFTAYVPLRALHALGWIKGAGWRPPDQDEEASAPSAHRMPSSQPSRSPRSSRKAMRESATCSA